MIGKAKIFILALFKPNKRVPPVKFPVKWHHKCVLVLVRRCKNFKECPKEISYYDWSHALRHASAYYERLKVCSVLVAAVWITLIVRRRMEVKRKNDIEARVAKGLPTIIPKYQLGLTTDQFHHTYNSPFPGDE